MKKNGSWVAGALLGVGLLAGDVASQATLPTDRIARASVSSGGAQGNALSADALISADGRFVAFSSDATNLVPGDTNAVRDAFLRDRSAHKTIRVSVSSAGVEGNALSSVSDPSPISADGRYVVFYSSADNLVPGDTNLVRDCFVR